MVQLVCQLLIAIAMVISMFMTLHNDIEGTSGKKPAGYRGVVGTMISMAVATLIQYGAGSFSQILP